MKLKNKKKKTVNKKLKLWHLIRFQEFAYFDEPHILYENIDNFKTIPKEHKPLGLIFDLNT